MSTNDWIRIITALAVTAITLLVGFKSLFKKSNFFTSKVIAATGVLTTIEIILQIIGNFIAIGPVSINLSLIPIALGAILYGPACGAFLGVINGLAVIFAPSTMAIFMPMNPLGTIFLCILKSTLAGMLAGYIYRIFKKKLPLLGAVIASISVPVINTGIFAIGCLLFFRDFLNDPGVIGNLPNMYAALFIAVIGWNFIFELAANTILSPAISRVVTIVGKRNEN